MKDFFKPDQKEKIVEDGGLSENGPKQRIVEENKGEILGERFRNCHLKKPVRGIS